MHCRETLVVVASLLHQATMATAQGDCKRDEPAAAVAARQAGGTGTAGVTGIPTGGTTRINGTSAIVTGTPAVIVSGTTATPIITATAQATECSSLQQSLLSALPTLPAILTPVAQTAVMPATTLSDICAVSVPTTAASAWTSYNLAYYDYFRSRSADIVSIATKCPAAAGITGVTTTESPAAATSSLNSVLTAYSAFSASGCRKEEATGTAGGASPSGTANAAGPRETGSAVNIVVAAAIGVAGAVIAL